MPSAPTTRPLPGWDEDHLDSATAPVHRPPYYDRELESWVLTRHADILAAFRASTLSPSGPDTTKRATPQSDDLLLTMRNETLEALSPIRLHIWREDLALTARTLASGLPRNRPADLLNEYARPLCLSLAAQVSNIPLVEAHRLLPQARRSSAASADPFDPLLKAAAKAAGRDLRACFHTGPEALRESAFVALSQTVPAILGNAWFALIEHPDAWRLLHRQPDLVDQAIEELLRYAGLVRVLYRTATADLSLNGTPIRAGDRVILRIIAANRDPERFPDPNRIELTRAGSGHLALGAGPHACVGASLIRMAAITLTSPLIESFPSAALSGSVEWQGGAGFRFPASLRVTLASS